MNLATLTEAHPADRPALCGAEGWLDWGEVRRHARSVKLGLARLGVVPGERVALAWPTSVDFVVGYLGILAAGAVVVPLNPVSPAGELEREISFVEPAAIICAGECAKVISGLLEQIVPAGRVLAPAGDGGDAGGDTVWDAVLRAGGTGPKADGTELHAVDRDDEDPAVMLFTSGTSSSPRVCVLTHGNLVANLRQMLAVPGRLLDADDVGLAAVPFFHVFGLNVVLGLTLATGAGLVCEERFEPEAALRLVEERGVTVIAGAPPMFADWADMRGGARGASGRSVCSSRAQLHSLPRWPTGSPRSSGSPSGRGTA